MRVTRIYFFNWFSWDIFFSSSVSFAFLFFWLFLCFLNLKIYILIQIRLCGRVSDKNIFQPANFRKQDYCFFDLFEVVLLPLLLKVFLFFTLKKQIFARNNSGIHCFERPLKPFTVTAQKIKSSIKDFFSKWNQIRSFLRIWSHLLKKSLMKNFIFCAVSYQKFYSVRSLFANSSTKVRYTSFLKKKSCRIVL